MSFHRHDNDSYLSILGIVLKAMLRTWVHDSFIWPTVSRRASGLQGTHGSLQLDIQRDRVLLGTSALGCPGL